MTRDYVLNSVSMDNPELVAYIREVQLKPTTQQDPLNATQTTEEKYVAGLTEGKREGVYVEYISRVRNDLLIRLIAGILAQASGDSFHRRNNLRLFQELLHFCQQ